MESMWNEEKERGLTEFSERSDKEEALYFVGRRGLITGIEKTVGQMRRLVAGKEVSDLVSSGLNLSDQRTWLVQGAPGAGKSALLSNLQRIWAEQKDGPVSVRVDYLELENESELIKTIANAIRSDGAAILNSFQTRELEGGLKFWGSGVGVKATETKKSESLTFRHLWRLYDKRLPDFIWKRLPARFKPKVSTLQLVVLTIDEIQNLTSQGEKLLSRIHLGEHGFPIVAVLAGLAWSRSRLNDAGISRLSKGHVRTLEPLSEAEAAEAVRLLLEQYEIEGFQDAPVARKIAMWSDGWPQHLHNYMCVLATELVNRKGDLAAVDEKRIREEGSRMRNDYYMERLDDSRIRACVNLLADIAEMIGNDGCDESVLLRFLRSRPWDDERDPADSMPQDMKPQGFINEMTRTGIIHSEDDRIRIPIPSFRQHLINRRFNQKFVSEV